MQYILYIKIWIYVIIYIYINQDQIWWDVHWFLIVPTSWFTYHFMCVKSQLNSVCPFNQSVLSPALGPPTCRSEVWSPNGTSCPSIHNLAAGWFRCCQGHWASFPSHDTSRKIKHTVFCLIQLAPKQFKRKLHKSSGRDQHWRGKL